MNFMRVYLMLVTLLVSFILGGVLGTVEPMWKRQQGKCVPGNAVEYDGTLRAWLDREGAVVMLAEDEGTFDWCTRP